MGVVLDEVYSGVKAGNQFDELLCVKGRIVEVFYQAVFKCNAFFCFLRYIFNDPISLSRGYFLAGGIIFSRSLSVGA